MTTASTTFATWREGLPAVLAIALGLTPAAVAWQGQPRVQIRGPRAQLEAGAPIVRGVDVRRMRDDGVEELVGVRSLPITVRVWTADNALELSPRSLVERASTRLRWTRVLEALRALDLSLERVGPSIHSPVSQDGRTLDESFLELAFGYVWIEADEEVPVGYVASAGITPHFWRDSGGAPLAGELQAPFDVVRGPSFGLDFDASFASRSAARVASSSGYSVAFDSSFGGGA